MDPPSEPTRNRPHIGGEDSLGSLESSYEVVPTLPKERRGGAGYKAERDRESERDHYADREKPRHREVWPEDEKELTRMIGMRLAL